MEPGPSTLPLASILLRGLRARCPQCGKGGLYRRWMVLVDRCSECSCEIKRREGDCWAFLYASTAFITGLFIVAMLITRVSQILLGQILFGITAAVVLILSLPYRKGLAIAIDYVLESRNAQF